MGSAFSRGKVPTELNLFDWALKKEERGAGEILFTHG
jgi:imidazole glycerol phosphate synthase subunit HisF